MENAFKGLGSTLLKVGTILGVGMGIKGFIDDAAEAEAGVSQLNAVLASTKGASGMTAKGVQDIASGLQKLTKFSDDEILSGQNLLLTFTKIGKDVFPMATETMLNMATALGTDAKGSAIQLGKALNDPIKGITALSRVGVTFTKAQKDSIAAMIKHGDVAGAQKVILKELETEFGNSAKAAGTTFAGKLVILKNQFGEVSEAIGGKLLPILGGFLTWVLDKMPQIQNAIGVAMDFIENVFKNAKDAWGFFIDGIKGAGDPDALIGTWQGAIYKLGEVAKVLGDWIKSNMPAIKEFTVGAFNAIKNIFKIVADYVTTVLVPAFDSFYKWIQPYMPAIKQAVSDAFTVIKNVMKVASDFINTNVLPIYGILAKWFVENFPKMKDAVMQAYNYIKPSFDKLVATIRTDLMPIIMGLWDTVKKAMPGIKAIFEIVFPVLVWVIAKVIDAITNFIKDVKGIYNFVKPGLDNVANIFSSVFGGIKKLIDGVQNVLNLFNKTKIKDKNATVTTKYVESKDGRSIGQNASGTDNWQGGLTHINEVGGEIVDLPSGTRIIPHDVSMEMAKNNSKGINGLTLTIGTFINNRKEDVQELAEELQFYMKQKELGGSK